MQRVRPGLSAMKCRIRVVNCVEIDLRAMTNRMHLRSSTSESPAISHCVRIVIGFVSLFHRAMLLSV